MEAFTNLNGSKTNKGNYVWGAALTLAWKNLIDQIIKENIKIQSDKKEALEIVSNFNQSPVNFGILSESSYYAKTGFGNKTVHLINQEVAKKFPEKTTTPVVANLQDDSIISFAYFFKKLLFKNPFNAGEVHFKGQMVNGFSAKTVEQKSQVFVSYHHDNDNFLIELKTKEKNDHVFILKTTKNLTPEQVLEEIANAKPAKEHLSKDEAFEMPKISLKHSRSVNELLGVFLANEKFSQYFFGEIYEIINFDLDEIGVKVENEGVIKMLRCGMPVHHRRFVVDKPFWVVMRESEKHPYFLANITDLEQ